MFSKNERFNRWSIRKVTVGVASVIVASGVFFLVGGADAHAAEDSGNGSAITTVAKSDVPNSEAEKSEVKVDKEASQKEKVVEKKETAVEVDKVTTDKKEVSEEKVEKEEVSEKTSVAEVQKAVVENTKSEVDVPASYLDKANFPGPFTAGVNQVIPYEFFGGDGMLTRLILNSSTKAPWSDNGVDKNAALLPVEKLGNGQYFYEVDLDGVAKGKSDKELLDILKATGTQNYKAVIKVYAAKDGKADLSNVVATKDLNVHLNGITSVAEVQKAVVENTKSEVEVPASYLDKANFPGPFTAGVNQVIPYEFFGGDGMLTRLILNSSTKAPWSDNGVDKNAALLPVEKLGNGQYFYEVDLDGVAKGKSDKELLDILKATGTQNYKAVIKVYAAKDGKADLSNVVATKELIVKLHKNDKIQQQNKQMMHEDSMMNKNDKMQQQNKQMMHENKMMNKKDDMMKQNQTMMADKENMDHGMMMAENQTVMPKDNMMSTEMSNMMSENHKMQNKMMLPKTSSDNSSQTTGVLAGVFASILAFFGLRRKANN